MSDPDVQSQAPYRSPSPVSDEQPAKTKRTLSIVMWALLFGVGIAIGAGYALLAPRVPDAVQDPPQIGEYIKDFGGGDRILPDDYISKDDR